jgi:hypothetical protein
MRGGHYSIFRDSAHLSVSQIANIARKIDEYGWQQLTNFRRLCRLTIDITPWWAPESEHGSVVPIRRWRVAAWGRIDFVGLL